MQMGQSVIKYFIIIFLFQNLSSQIKLNGTYCEKFSKEFSKCFSFNRGKFIYEKKGSYSIQNYGSGTYKQCNGKLFLNFNSALSKNKSYHEIVDRKKSNKNYYYLVLKIKDVEGNLPNTRIIINDTIIKESDFFGNISCSIPKSNSKIRIKLSRLGNDNYSFSLSPNKDYKIQVYLNQFSGTQITNIKKEKKIEILNRNSFKEYRKNGTIIIWNKYKP